MPEKRNITKEDIFLKARLRAEGIRLEEKGPPIWKPLHNAPGPFIVLDGCDMVASTMPNARSSLEAIFDGYDVTISENSEVLATGTLWERASWRDRLMSDGTIVEEACNYDSVIMAVVIHTGCYTYLSGKGCKYCHLAPESFSEPPLSFSETLKQAGRQIEAVVTAIQGGWRGLLLLSGGAALPERRGQWTTDIIEAVMSRFHELVDDDTLAQLQIAPQVYPPDDLGELYKWKSFGINSTEFDNEVMDPAYFKAICPGRGEKRYWYEAQEASSEVFGRGRGAITNIVCGLEPMAGMLEGIEERISKGVYTMPVMFGPMPGTPLAGMRPPSVEWYIEAFEKMADIYLHYADTLDINLTEDDRWGYTRRGSSIFYSYLHDEMSRRLQEMGKFPPGLPKQDGIEVT